MFSYLANCINGSIDLVKGLAVTFRTMLRPNVTIQYPFEKKPVAERYRGIMGLTAKAGYDMQKQAEGETTEHLACISCFKCMDACPVECIDIQRERSGKGKFLLKAFSINFARCTFCALCVDACPVKGKAIIHSRHYEEVFFERKNMVFDIKKLEMVGQGVRPNDPEGERFELSTFAVEKKK